MIHTLNELLLPRTCPTTDCGLSGKESEFDFVVTNGGARGVPYPVCDCGPPNVFNPIPEPRREPAAAKLIFEQNDMFDLRRELCLSNVFCAENGDGRTK